MACREGRGGKGRRHATWLRCAARRNFILAPIIWHGPLQGRRAEDIHSERERERAAGRTMKGQLTSLWMPRHNGHYADFESIIENFIEKLSLFLSLSLYTYMSVSFSLQVGNCVGKRNYRFFYLFLVSLAFLAVFIFSCSVTHLVLCKYTL